MCKSDRKNLAPGDFDSFTDPQSTATAQVLPSGVTVDGRCSQELVTPTHAAGSGA